MTKKYKLAFLALLLLGLGFLTTRYLLDNNIAVLNPQGPVAERERNLIYFALALSLIVVIPVFILAGFIAWRYRESNAKAKYSPELDHNFVAESLWWLIPGILIVILSVVTWNSSHELDPARALNSSVKPITIQVVAMEWKWLFIYPEQNIATVNYIQIPLNTPVNFEITADAPMNSFWVPQLGGQIYAMAGMSTRLQLEATKAGSYRGSSANISGRGFASMTFTVEAQSQTEFQRWVQFIKSSNHALSLATYSSLSEPSQNNPYTFYSSTEPSLYGGIMTKYMMPGMDGMMR